jgi:hypothetical protein
MAKLTDNTVVSDRHGLPVPLAAGTEVPKWAAKQVGDHLLEDAKPSRSSRSSKAKAPADAALAPADDADADVDDESEEDADSDDESADNSGDESGSGDGSEAPPRTGRGSGADAWREYATGLGIEVPEDAGRDDIVALVEARS